MSGSRLTGISGSRLTGISGSHLTGISGSCRIGISGSRRIGFSGSGVRGRSGARSDTVRLLDEQGVAPCSVGRKDSREAIVPCGVVVPAVHRARSRPVYTGKHKAQHQFVRALI